MRHILFLDTETTGLHEVGRLLEVGVALWSVSHRSLVRARSWLIEGAEENPQESTNGIPAALTAEGVPFEQMEIELAAYMSHADLVIAHNVDFDREWFDSCHAMKPWACSMDDFDWPRGSSSKSLAAVALAHGVGVVHAHRALSDVMTLVALFERVAEMKAHEPDDHTDDRNVRGAFDVWLARAARPRAIFEVAEKNFDAERNAKAKELGFRWVAEKKSWRRRLAIEDAGKLPFRVVEVRP